MIDKLIPVGVAIGVGVASVPVLNALDTALGNRMYYVGAIGLGIGGAIAALAPENMPWLAAAGFGLAAVGAASLYSDYEVQKAIYVAKNPNRSQVTGLGSIVGALPTEQFVFNSADMAARDPRIVAARGPAWSRR